MHSFRVPEISIECDSSYFIFHTLLTVEHGDVCAPSGECDVSIDLYCIIDPDQATCQCPTAHSYKGAYGRCIHNQGELGRP